MVKLCTTKPEAANVECNDHRSCFVQGKDVDKVPLHVPIRYQAFGWFDKDTCTWGSMHAEPEDHRYECLFPMSNHVAALPHILDGSLTHLIDDTSDF